MDSGDSDNKIILIKQEIESNEINETVDVANIKFEQEDATYGIQCDGVKVETLNLKHQDENETEMFNPEYVWVDSKQEEVWKAESEKIDAIVSDSSQPTEESGNIESNTNAETTYYPEQHRMKVELTDENWCSTAIDGDVQVKTEVKSEKLEDEAYMVPKFEQMDTLDLNEEVDIRPDGDPITTSDSDCATQEKRSGEELQVGRAESEIELFLCYKCNYIDSSKIDLMKHIKLGKCKSKLNLSESSEEETILDDHVIKKHVSSIAPVSIKIHKSPQSNQKSTNENNITRHLSTHPWALSMLSIICKPCNASFKSNLSFDNHILKKHPEFKTSIKSTIYECTQCNYKTTYKSHLGSHSSTHLSIFDNPDICKYCDRSFRDQLILDNHIMKKHPEFKASIRSKLYECSYCTYKTTVKRYLKSHMPIHSIVCKHCNKSFHRISILDNHIIKKHPDFIASVKRKIHECLCCAFKSISKRVVDKHMLIHHTDKSSTEEYNVHIARTEPH